MDSHIPHTTPKQPHYCRTEQLPVVVEEAVAVALGVVGNDDADGVRDETMKEPAQQQQRQAGRPTELEQ